MLLVQAKFDHFKKMRYINCNFLVSLSLTFLDINQNEDFFMFWKKIHFFKKREDSIQVIAAFEWHQEMVFTGDCSVLHLLCSVKGGNIMLCSV